MKAETLTSIQDLLEHPQVILVLLSLFVLIFILLLVLVIFSVKRKNQLDSFERFNDEITESINRLHLSLIEGQRNLDEKLSREQQHLFDRVSQDREKQLQSMTELRVNLEKRFADSGANVTTNIQVLKTDLVERFEKLQRTVSMSLADGQQLLSTRINSLSEKISQGMEKHQTETRESIVDNIRKGIKELRGDLDRNTQMQNDSLNKSIQGLTQTTDNRLKDIGGQVEKRLGEGFDKTTKTFNDVLKRLALIDDAQKKITELSSNVISLQEILNDKRSRGAFGEVQLQSLVSNIMPDTHYFMQQTLSNNKVADCVLVLPEPTGKIAIDSKFPLESYKKMMDVQLGKLDRKDAAKQFAKDVKKHINDIADKYVLPPETSDGAVMFIPAESIFAEIHGHYPELVDFAYKRKVWLVSPTTFMAILTTASTVIKDEKTRQQVHIIQEHLSLLGKDFERFQSRMDSLSRHISQANEDVKQVNTSARKITSRFGKIERVELKDDDFDKESDLLLTVSDDSVSKRAKKKS